MDIFLFLIRYRNKQTRQNKYDMWRKRK